MGNIIIVCANSTEFYKIYKSLYMDSNHRTQLMYYMHFLSTVKFPGTSQCYAEILICYCLVNVLMNSSELHFTNASPICILSVKMIPI